MGKPILQRPKYIRWLYEKDKEIIKYGHYVEIFSDFSGSFDDIIAFNSHFMKLLSMPYMNYIIEFLDNIGFLDDPRFKMYKHSKIYINSNIALSYISKIEFDYMNIGHRGLYEAARAAGISLPGDRAILSNPLFINEIENYIRDPVSDKHFPYLDIHPELFNNTDIEIDKSYLSLNPAAVPILKQYRSMINWEYIIKNPEAIEFMQCDTITDMQKKYAETQDPKLKNILYYKIVKEIISHTKKYNTPIPRFMPKHIVRYAEKKSVPDNFIRHAISHLSY
jgi:hypothetical protein